MGLVELVGVLRQRLSDQRQIRQIRQIDPGVDSKKYHTYKPVYHGIKTDKTDSPGRRAAEMIDASVWWH